MLEYLSDDEIYGRAERRARRKKRKAKRKAKKAKRQTKRSERRKRKGKRPSRKERRKKEGRPSRIARIGLAPARGAFHTAVRTNIGKLATKLVRIHSKPGGPEKLHEFWRKFGGKWKGLRKSINKGGKASISNDEVGVAMAAVAAVAAPLMIAAAALIKQFKAGGSKQEMEDYEDIIEMGKEELATNPEYDNMSTADMEGEDMAVMYNDDDYDDDDIPRTTGFSFTSLSGMLFKTIFIIPTLSLENPVLIFLATIISSYCVIGVFLFPFKMAGKTWAELYYRPVNWLLNAFTKNSRYGTNRS